MILYLECKPYHPRKPNIMFGKLYLHLIQMQLEYRYKLLLNNGTDVFNQNALSNVNNNASVIDKLSFIDGPIFSIRDGFSAAHTFNEIFINKYYSQGKLQKALREAKIIIDVGANIGLFTYFALRSNDIAHLYCFEADPQTFRILDSNIQQLPAALIKRTTIDNYAVCGTSGYIPFYSSDISGWSSCYKTLGAKNGNIVNVKSIRLSDYLINHNIEQVDFLKIDVEGAEYDIILGDKNLLVHDIRALVVEVDLSPRDSRYRYNYLIEALRYKFSHVEINSKNGSKYPLIYCWNRKAK